MPTRLIVLAPAADAEEAVDKCPSLPAYKEMLAEYPETSWRQRWVKTHAHSLSLWAVEFEVEERPIILMP